MEGAGQAPWQICLHFSYDKVSRFRRFYSLIPIQFVTEPFFMSATYSQCRLYNQESLGADAYRYGQYVAVNGVFEPTTGLQFGLEYLWGKRTDSCHISNHANRMMLMAAYSF